MDIGNLVGGLGHNRSESESEEVFDMKQSSADNFHLLKRLAEAEQKQKEKNDVAKKVLTTTEKM